MIKSFKKSKHVKLKGEAYRKFKWQIAERDDFTCQICGNQNRDELELMHKIHKGAGGKAGPGDTPENTFTGCIYCHRDEEYNLNGKLKR